MSSVVVSLLHSFCFLVRSRAQLHLEIIALRHQLAVVKTRRARRCSEGHLPRAPGRAGVAHLGSSEIGYSLLIRGVLGAGSRSALPLRFSVVFEYGGLIP